MLFTLRMLLELWCQGIVWHKLLVCIPIVVVFLLSTTMSTMHPPPPPPPRGRAPVASVKAIGTRVLPTPPPPSAMDASSTSQKKVVTGLDLSLEQLVRKDKEDKKELTAKEKKKEWFGVLQKDIAEQKAARRARRAAKQSTGSTKGKPPTKAKAPAKRSRSKSSTCSRRKRSSKRRKRQSSSGTSSSSPAKEEPANLASVEPVPRQGASTTEDLPAMPGPLVPSPQLVPSTQVVHASDAVKFLQDAITSNLLTREMLVSVGHQLIGIALIKPVSVKKEKEE
jgi:hypothetical protein